MQNFSCKIKLVKNRHTVIAFSISDEIFFLKNAFVKNFGKLDISKADLEI